MGLVGVISLFYIARASEMMIPLPMDLPVTRSLFVPYQGCRFAILVGVCFLVMPMMSVMKPIAVV
jgi:hypothetical protein